MPDVLYAYIFLSRIHLIVQLRKNIQLAVSIVYQVPITFKPPSDSFIYYSIYNDNLTTSNLQLDDPYPTESSFLIFTHLL